MHFKKKLLHYISIIGLVTFFIVSMSLDVNAAKTEPYSDWNSINLNF